jgi:hypothetical protein
MRNVKIIKKLSYDNPPKIYYKIQEVVTTKGHTIEWNGIYTTPEDAQKVIDLAN